MRIDLTTSGVQQPENTNTGRAGRSGTGANQSSASAGTADDHTQFSFDGPRIQSLQAQALTAPEIRQAKVTTLGQAIGSGQYTVDASKVADAMTAEFSGVSIR